MKKMKSTLVAILVAGAFETLCAFALEESIKNVKVSGYARYRYEASSWAEKSQDLEAGGITSKQEHRFKSALGIGFDAGESFKIYGQLFYNSDRNDGYRGYDTATKNPITLRQAILEYRLSDFRLILGRQELKPFGRLILWVWLRGRFTSLLAIYT